MIYDLITGDCTPESVGLRSADVLKCLQALDATENEIHGFAAARHGKLFAETYLAPYGAQIPHANHSMGKSYTCTGLGIACTEGLLSPEDPVCDVFAGEIARFGATPDANMRKMKLKHLMSMSCGMERMPDMDEHWMENFLQSPVKYEPGTRFLYNSIGSCMLGAAVEKATGRELDAYMREKLFSHIGIGPDDLVWRRFGNGRLAEPGTSATTRTNLRLGLFYLAQGEADGLPIVSKDWMRQATTRQIDTPASAGEEDLSRGYGWQLWMCSHPGMVRFDGGQGQFCIIDLQRDMVVAIHEGGVHPHGVQKVLDLTEALMAGAQDTPLPEDPTAYAALTAYLQARAAAPAEALPVPDGAQRFAGTYAVTEGVFNPWIEVAPVDADFYHLFYEPSVRPEVLVFDVDITPEQVVLTLNRSTVLRARLDGKWQRQEAATPIPPLKYYAAAARFTDADTLHISLRWLNGWCRPELTFRLHGESDVAIATEKDMLHEGRAPFTRHAKARKIR
ncbi:MAG TPA: serine hydrolase domain-containing protein [Candidatus Limiplasma sp.]|nr:serine hydrolase domain-containing protein [Candidatus Limiplasma sp.]